jgi:uncharacterized protein YndB with AHSA1/START domain
MKYETSTKTAAEPSRLWAVLTDVESWPEWIEVYEEVRRTASGPLTEGERVHIKQKGLAAGDWTVSELEEGKVFGWESKQPGVQLVARHIVTPEPDGGSRLILQLEQSGWLSGVVSALLAKKIRSYVDLEGVRLSAVADHSATA